MLCHGTSVEVRRRAGFSIKMLKTVNATNQHGAVLAFRGMHASRYITDRKADAPFIAGVGIGGMGRVAMMKRNLTRIERHFYRILLRSHSEGAATYTPKRAQRALAEVGVPVARAYVGLNNGVYAAYPGHGGWPDEFDHRETPWFELAQKRRGPIWGAPSPDLHGLGLVLTCAQALYDSEDNLLGVAGIDVTFDYIIEELLELPDTVDIESVESYLLDPSGNIVIGSRHHENVSAESFKLKPFHNASVLSAIKEKRSGHLIEKGELILYNRMHSIGWYYVVVGPEGDLL